MTAPDEPTQQLPPTRPRGRDRRGPAIVVGMGLALLAGLVIWAIVASSGGDDDRVSIGPSPSTDGTTTTSAPPPTVATTLPSPSVALVPTTAFTPGSVVIVPTAPPTTAATSPPPTDGPTPTTPTAPPTSRPRPDVDAITAALTEALLGPDAEPPDEPVVRAVLRRRQVRVTWKVGNEDDLDLARTGAYDEAIALVQTLASFPELESRGIVLDGTYPLDPDGDGTATPSRVIRLVFAADAFDGIDLEALDAAALVDLASRAVIDPEFALEA